MLIFTPGLAATKASAAAWMVSSRGPWLKECQKVISPSKGASGASGVSGVSPSGVVVAGAGVGVAVLPPLDGPPQAVSRVKSMAHARSRDSAFFIISSFLHSVLLVVLTNHIIKLAGIVYQSKNYQKVA